MSIEYLAANLKQVYAIQHTVHMLQGHATL